MLKTIFTATAITLALASSAQADINTSLDKVCDNARQQGKSEKVSVTNTTQQDYQSRLASYYTGVSCQGKSLILSSHRLNSEEEDSLADNSDNIRL